MASAFASALVLALYIDSDAVREQYHYPAMVWPLAPIVLYMTMRIWILARRDEMHDDPIVFIIRDWRKPAGRGNRRRPAGGRGPLPMSAGHQSFGRIFPAASALMDASEAVRRLEGGRLRPGAMLAVGNLRSYGDSCLNSAGSIADMRSKNHIISFDPATGLLEAEAGAMLPQVIAAAAPHGFFPTGRPRHAIRDDRWRDRQ
jgi:hypothetical protein